ncbi:hypothetical protein HHK36_016896 [Tetracentron sinense]|uniref:Uncharacterized protein n=1 Tax=Tetracentron sinense TaxID=13715 RepID=A0A834Z0C2_TETSI|nr:hypothetical protein HHK36_016896 [Tetracentron sinense]
MGFLLRFCVSLNLLLRQPHHFRFSYDDDSFRLCLCRSPASSVSGDCRSGYGCFSAEAASPEIKSRKILDGPEKVRDDGNLVGWELRKVPSGPDPLHHNGGSPTKPRTP